MRVRIRGFFGWLDRVPMRVADFFFVLTEGGKERRSRGREREGFALYFFFLAVEVFLGGATRWMMTRGAIFWIDLVVPLGSWVVVVPWVIALRRPVWSMAALAHIGGHGDERLDPDIAHRPDKEERQQLFVAMADLWTYDVNISMPKRVVIIDYPIAGAMVRRDTLLFTTTAIWSPALPALLGHELSHLCSSDPWLGVAVERLGKGVDPYPGLQLEYMPGAWKLLGLLCLPGHWAIRLARGGMGEQMLFSRLDRLQTGARADRRRLCCLARPSRADLPVPTLGAPSGRWSVAVDRCPYAPPSSGRTDRPSTGAAAASPVRRPRRRSSCGDGSTRSDPGLGRQPSS